jgi:hypothetical protein
MSSSVLIRLGGPVATGGWPCCDHARVAVLLPGKGHGSRFHREGPPEGAL